MPTATSKEKKSTKKKAKATITKEAGGKGVKVTPAPKKKGAKATKGTKKASVKKEAGEKGPSHRLRLFQALEKHPNGLSRGPLKEATGGGMVTRIVTAEINRTDGAKPRIKAEKVEGSQGRTYSLTAAGLKALKDGTVDSEAPSMS